MDEKKTAARRILELEKYDTSALRDIMALLRSEDGCPWDREQTHASIRRDFIEETYEAIDAIDREDTDLLREELGDVLLQIVFHAAIEEERGTFTFDDVTDEICRKLIHRHPHVFGDVTVGGSDDVLVNWDRLKLEEKTERVTVTDELRAVPSSLPALMKAQKVGKKAGKVGFDFASAGDAMEKIYEEADEVAELLPPAGGSSEDALRDRLEEEIGDLLLAVTNVARFVGVDTEVALNRATEKFIVRFEGVENETKTAGKCIKDMTEDELIALWNAEKDKKSKK